MLKEVQEVKVGGRMQRIHVRPFAWSSRVPLGAGGEPQPLRLPNPPISPGPGGDAPGDSGTGGGRGGFPWI